MVFDVILVDGDKDDSVFVFFLYFYDKSSNKELAVSRQHRLNMCAAGKGVDSCKIEEADF